MISIVLILRGDTKGWREPREINWVQRGVAPSWKREPVLGAHSYLSCWSQPFNYVRLARQNEADGAADATRDGFVQIAEVPICSRIIDRYIGPESARYTAKFILLMILEQSD